MRDPGISSTVSGVRDGDLVDLLARVESASGADRRLELDLHDQLLGRLHREPFAPEDGSRIPHYTASLDASLGLVERQKGSGIDAAQMLHEALEDMANGGWRDDQPIGPQAARRLLATMLRSMIDE